MKNLSENRRLTIAIKGLFASLLLACFGFSEPLTRKQTHYGELELVFRGNYLSLYTSGRVIKQNKHPKSSVWNVPSRKLKEMWVKRGEDSTLIRLDPKTFRRQLVGLVMDFPEVHEAILHNQFTYKGLSQGIVELNDHMAKVIIVRQKKAGFKTEKVNHNLAPKIKS